MEDQSSNLSVIVPVITAVITSLVTLIGILASNRRNRELLEYKMDTFGSAITKMSEVQQDHGKQLHEHDKRITVLEAKVRNIH